MFLVSLLMLSVVSLASVGVENASRRARRRRGHSSGVPVGVPGLMAPGEPGSHGALPPGAPDETYQPREGITGDVWLVAQAGGQSVASRTGRASSHATIEAYLLDQIFRNSGKSD